MNETENKIYMSDADLYKVQLNIERNKFFQKQLELDAALQEKQKYAKKFVESQLALVNKESTILDMKKAKSDAEYLVFMDQSRTLLNEIAKKHGIEGKRWGYDPETGEIIINE